MNLRTCRILPGRREGTIVRISRQGDNDRQAVPRSTTFAGGVWGEPLVEVPDTAVNHIMFTPGSHTNWHRHAGGQILYVTDGQGKVRSRDGEEATISPGDTVWAPPGEEHYHGADGNRFFSHLAISFGTTEWLEPVAAEEYGSAE